MRTADKEVLDQRVRIHTHGTGDKKTTMLFMEWTCEDETEAKRLREEIQELIHKSYTETISRNSTKNP